MTHNYKISVLLPTRGRTTALKLSVVSLFNRALDLDSIQLILGFDKDDLVGLKFFSEDVQPWMEEKGVHYKVMIFDPMGYSGLNRYMNSLAANSDSDWLFIWNDDALMETTGWDRIIAKYDGDFKLLKVHTHREHPYSIFPIFPREWYDLFGFISRHQMMDGELSQNAYMLDLIEIVDIHVTHDRADITGNNRDETYKAKELLEGNLSDKRDFHHTIYANARLADCELISQHLKKTRNKDMSWWENVKAGKQDPWEKLKKNDINKQMIQYPRPGQQLTVKSK